MNVGWRSIPNIPIHLPGTFNECLDMGQVNLDILQPHFKETQLTLTESKIIVSDDIVVNV